MRLIYIHVCYDFKLLFLMGKTELHVIDNYYQLIFKFLPDIWACFDSDTHLNCMYNVL